MRQALYTFAVRVSWTVPEGKPNAGQWQCHETGIGLRAPSTRSANTRAIRWAVRLPCFKDRAMDPVSWRVEAEVSLIRVLPAGSNVPSLEQPARWQT